MTNQWLAIRPTEPENAGTSVSVQLPHPRTGEPNRYVVQENGGLLEVQKVEGEHKQSWFIGNSVQKDGVLYLMTPIDPLFVMLPLLDQIRKKCAEFEGRFVEFDNVFGGEDEDDDQRYKSIHHLAAIPGIANQLTHLCDKHEYVQGEYAYRLNEGKALHWLRLKVQAIADNIERMPVLLQFITEQLFDINAPQTDTIIRSEAYAWVGIQVVSEYLTAAWQERLANSYTLVNLEKQVEEHKNKQEIEFQNYCTTNPTDFAKAKREASDISDQSSKKSKLSAGQKTLAKANIKGMKSLTSFFTKKGK